MQVGDEVVCVDGCPHDNLYDGDMFTVLRVRDSALAGVQMLTVREYGMTDFFSSRFELATKKAPKGLDMVNNPSHYTWHPAKVEAIDIIEVFPHNLAAAMGYIWRCDHKGEFESDVKKAIWHLQRELSRRSSEPSTEPPF